MPRSYFSERLLFSVHVVYVRSKDREEDFIFKYFRILGKLETQRADF